MVVIISCWRRVSGKSGDIRTPKVAKAWYKASGMRLWEATISDDPPPADGCTGAAYSFGYSNFCSSKALRRFSLASSSGMVRIQAMTCLEHWVFVKSLSNTAFYLPRFALYMALNEFIRGLPA